MEMVEEEVMMPAAAFPLLFAFELEGDVGLVP
jgi:hypothetical protein